MDFVIAKDPREGGAGMKGIGAFAELRRSWRAVPPQFKALVRMFVAWAIIITIASMLCLTYVLAHAVGAVPTWLAYGLVLVTVAGCVWMCEGEYEDGWRRYWAAVDRKKY